jgi:Ca-activated chloride channel family protein
MTSFKLQLLAGAMLAFALTGAASATPPDKDDNSVIEEVVVTGSMGVRQGGAQDINAFRGQAMTEIPISESLTPEGLMGGYDLRIPGPPCAKLFCLTAESQPADIMGRPKDRLFVGLGFNTAIKAETWKRAPLNLVAVVDKSGSMSGQPLELVRQSLLQIASQMGPEDQIGIVLYGDRAHVYLAPTRLTGANRAAVEAAIRGIESAGSTDMESGLKVGYAAAFASRDGFQGATRLMLFTDEQPNVGATDADSFMGMAEAASRKGVGLTTIGVGVQYDGALATKISSVRGGNLYFMRDAADVAQVFHDKLDTMVSELAFDLELKLSPAPGYRITGVYGVPGDVMSWGKAGSILVTVPTAFLSTEGGGIFATVAPANASLPAPETGGELLKVGLTYVAAADGKPGEDAISLAGPTGVPSADLRLAHMLVNEYLGLKEGADAFHAGDEDTAYKTLKALAERLDRAGDKRLDPERVMVAGLVTRAAQLAGYEGEAPRAEAAKTLNLAAMLGQWQVVGTLGHPGLRIGDRLDLRTDSEAVVVRKGKGPESATYETDGRKVRLSLEVREALFAYAVSRDHMTMVIPEDGSTIHFRRVPRDLPAAD